jgi:HSP20 family protein
VPAFRKPPAARAREPAPNTGPAKVRLLLRADVEGGLMNIVKWDPFRELEGIQSRLNRVFGERPFWDENRVAFGDWVPAVDIEETGTEYVVKADLPDVKKEDVKVEFENGVLTVEGERKFQKEEQGKTFHKVEREYGKFVRRFALPTEIDSAKLAAEFKDGVLNVHLPKSATQKPKAVTVNVA